MADEVTDTQTTETTEAQTTDAATTEGAQTTDAAEAGDGASTALGGDEDPAKGAEGEAEQKPAPPEKYELTPPEGFETLDAESLAEAEPVFRELNLDNEQAQKLIPVAGKFVKRLLDQRDQQMLSEVTATRKAWLDEAKADPEIGGKNWDASLEAAGKALDAAGYPKGHPFRTFLNESGLGNNVHMIRWARKVGELVGEDGDFVRADAAAKVEQPIEDRWYGQAGSKE